MIAFFEGRESNSIYVDRVFRGYVEQTYTPICPADWRWNFLFLKLEDHVEVAVEGPLTRALMKKSYAGSEFLVIQFRLGVFLQNVFMPNLHDQRILLPADSPRSFWLKNEAWQIPRFEEVETFVDHLVKDNILIAEPTVTAGHAYKTEMLSERTVQRRYLRSTGITPKMIDQIDRARNATSLLEQNIPISAVACELGYADQSHLTRSLKRFIGQTPNQIHKLIEKEYCPICSRHIGLVDLCSCGKSTLGAITNEQSDLRHRDVD